MTFCVKLSIEFVDVAMRLSLLCAGTPAQFFTGTVEFALDAEKHQGCRSAIISATIGPAIDSAIETDASNVCSKSTSIFPP